MLPSRKRLISSWDGAAQLVKALLLLIPDVKGGMAQKTGKYRRDTLQVKHSSHGLAD